MADKRLQKNLMRKKLLSVLLGIAVAFAAIPAGPAYAEEIAAVPGITLGSRLYIRETAGRSMSAETIFSASRL